jgi:hypothetical protein
MGDNNAAEPVTQAPEDLINVRRSMVSIPLRYDGGCRLGGW